MKHIPKSLLGFFTTIALLVSGFGSDENFMGAIVGKWQEIGGDNETLEFSENGTVSCVSKLMTLGGKYSRDGGDRLKMEFKGVTALVGPLIMRVSFSDGNLKLTDDKGKVSSYQRAKVVPKASAPEPANPSEAAEVYRKKRRRQLEGDIFDLERAIERGQEQVALYSKEVNDNLKAGETDQIQMKQATSKTEKSLIAIHLAALAASQVDSIVKKDKAQTDLINNKDRLVRLRKEMIELRD